MNKTIKRLIWCILAIGLLAPLASHAGVTLTNIFSFNGSNGIGPDTQRFYQVILQLP